MCDQSDGGRRVLVAEDDPQMRETFAIWLDDRDDWQTTEVGDGAEVLARIDDTYDLLVLDRKMPALDGPSVVDGLDATSFDGNVVVVTAFRPDSHLDPDDVTEYLLKPVDKRCYLDTLERGMPDSPGES